MIRIKNLTKDYGKGRGVFDLSFEIQDGETFGLLGAEGAGKTTVLRLLMGYADASSGRCFINGKNCRKQADEINRFTGYVPERISLPEHLTGIAFLRFLAQIRGVRSLEPAMNLARRFELDLDHKIGKMTEEDKQKTALAGAVLHDPAVLLFDEPVSGLDGLAKRRFREFIREEKSRGKTILMASRLFEEIDCTCDRAGILQDGTMIYLDDMAGVRAAGTKLFRIVFEKEQEAVRFVRKENFEVREKTGAQLVVAFSGNLKPLIHAMGNYEILEFEPVVLSLEEIFCNSSAPLNCYMQKAIENQLR